MGKSNERGKTKNPSEKECFPSKASNHSDELSSPMYGDFLYFTEFSVSRQGFLGQPTRSRCVEHLSATLTKNFSSSQPKLRNVGYKAPYVRFDTDFFHYAGFSASDGPKCGIWYI